MTADPASPNADDEISLPEAAAVLYRNRFVIGSVSLLMAVLAAGASFLVRPTFRAETLIAPVTASSSSALSSIAAQFDGLAGLAGVNLGQSGNKSTAVATLRSRSLSEAFIKDRNLLPLLFEGEWDATAAHWKSSDPVKIPTVSDAFLEFDKDIRTLQEDRKTGLLTLTIEWRDPDTAAAWANELVQRANLRLQQESIAESEKTIAYLTNQVAKAGTIEVRQTLFNLIEVETKNIAVAHAREEFAFKVIDPAMPPHKRSKPNRSRITLTGLLIGLVASCVWALLRRAGAFRADARQQ